MVLLRTASATGSAVVPRRVLLALGACVLMALSAQVRIPVAGTEVPMTLQPVAMLVIGLTMPTVSAVCGMVLYLLAGSAGLPVFALPSGLWGPTGGYLLGFIPAVFVAGLLVGGRSPGLGRLFLAGVAAMAVVFVCGVSWRTVLTGGDLFLALQTGMIPFASKAMVDVLLAGWASRMIDAARTRYSAFSIESACTRE
jgi:biotin transport system substrate-specific component